jgi:hypothetical protein
MSDLDRRSTAWTIAAVLVLEATLDITQSALAWLGVDQLIDLIVPAQAIVFLVLGFASLPIIVITRMLPLVARDTPDAALLFDVVAVGLAALLPCLAVRHMFGLPPCLASLKRFHILALLGLNAVSYWGISVLTQIAWRGPGLHTPATSLLAPVLGGLVLYAGAMTAVKARARPKAIKARARPKAIRR